MNLFDIIDRELRSKHLNEFEKLRYIYLKCCNIFSFDTRYYYMKLDKNLEEEILNKKFDLSNIQDTLVICHTFVNEILSVLINEFTTLTPEINSGYHSYIDVKYSGTSWRLDATLSDLSRVKMNLFTTGFYAYRSNFSSQIEEADLACGYISRRYTETLKMMIVEKLKWIEFNLKNSACNRSYADSSYFFKYLTATDDYESSTYYDSNFNFYRLIEVPEYDIYYELQKGKNNFYLEKIDDEECNRLSHSLKKRR